MTTAKYRGTHRASRGGQVEQGRPEGLVLGKLLPDLDPFAQKQARLRRVRDLGYYACDERRKRLRHLPWWGGAGSVVRSGGASLRSAVAGDAPARCSRRRPQSTCSCASGQTPAPRRLPPEAGEGAAQFVAGSLVARRKASSSRVGCVCRHASRAHAGLHKARAAPTCGSPSALLPTMTRGRPGLAASTCGRWDECEQRGSAQYGGRRGP
jgi:hypothetical protein